MGQRRRRPSHLSACALFGQQLYLLRQLCDLLAVAVVERLVVCVLQQQVVLLALGLAQAF